VEHQETLPIIGVRMLKRPRAEALAVALLLLLGAVVAELAWRRSFQDVAWPDEFIYLVGARNVAERGSLDTNYYLTYSLLRRGHPHRDVHLPGYVLALSPFVRALGTTLAAAVALNVPLYLASIVLVFLIARALLRSHLEAAAAAALFAILPPFPSYVGMALPEIATGFALLVGIAWLVTGRGRWHAVLAGVLFALGALLRETLLLALPIYALRLERRDLWRRFLPAALLTLLVVVAPLSRDRAVHPNALYPSAIEEARRTPRPVAALAGTVWRNARTNLADLRAARPFSDAEDAVLGVMLLLIAAPAVAWPRLKPEARRFAAGLLASLGLLTVAVVCLYVVRARGGVWGGVRAYMSFAPLLLVLLVPALVRHRRPLLGAVLISCLAGALLVLNEGQLYYFMRDRQATREDQARQARYLEEQVDAAAPARVLGRFFLYGLERYPAEVIWSLPRDAAELAALETVVPFDFVALHRRSGQRDLFGANPRYRRVNKAEKEAELLIWRRLY
jgi:hypothetical protein